jgi:HD-like signal output (HDOD) protein
VLGLTHAQVGGALLRDWRLPAEIVAGVEHHHDPDQAGEPARYAQLVLLANRALARNGIGDEVDDALPPAIVSALALSESVIVKVGERILAAHTELDHLAQALAA